MENQPPNEVSKINTPDSSVNEKAIEEYLISLNADERRLALELVIEAKGDISKIGAIYDKASVYIKSILGAVVFATAMQGDVPKTEHLQAHGLELADDVEALRKEIKSITDFDFIEMANSNSRVATLMKAETPSQLTIVHLGQSHKTDIETNDANSYEIIQSQKQISRILSSFAVPATRVFVEGYYEETMKAVEDVVSISNKFEALDSFTDIAYEYYYFIQSYQTTESIAVINKIVSDKLNKIGFKEILPLQLSNGKDKLSLVAPANLPTKSSFSTDSESHALLNGSSVLLNTKGVIQMMPAETERGSINPFMMTDVLKEKGKKLGEILLTINPKVYKYTADNILPEISAFSSYEITQLTQGDNCQKNVKCQMLAKEILENDIPKISTAIYEDRENVAIEQIAKYAKSGQKVIPLVFGQGHDFTGAVVKWNKSHPDKQFNLITIKPPSFAYGPSTSQ
ncbi:MAG: hypothetical protein JWN37_267 [Candidatus Nomurabacteria bacterium]|nr:hypothetical protein [Candidatus Nomurabacteria bacterium]